MKTFSNIKWWMPALMGFLLSFSAIYIMSQPVASFVGLSLLFGFMIFISGLLNLSFALQNRRMLHDWVWYLAFGVIEAVLGGALLVQPALSMEALILFAGFWLLFVGFLRISNAFLLKRLHVSSWWTLLLVGILSIIFAFFVLINPVVAVLSIVYLTSIPILFAGIISVFFGFTLRKLSFT